MADVRPEDFGAIPNPEDFGAVPVGSGEPRQAGSIWDDIASGYQSSATGLFARGKLPDVTLNPAHATWYDKALESAANVVSDLPEMVVGGAAGGMIGRVFGPRGIVKGAAIGAFAVPAEIRSALIKSYQSGEASSSADFLTRAGIVIKGLSDADVQKATAKAALIGGMTAAGGMYAARGVGSLIAPSIGTSIGVKTATRLIGGAQAGGAIAGMTVTPAALDGKLPEPQDFLNAAIVVGGLHSATAIAGKVGNIYSKSGVMPEQVVADAQIDPHVAIDLKPIEEPAKPDAAVTVFHGSPYIFNEMNNENIGSGEGSAAYGHGIYLTESADLASRYKGMNVAGTKPSIELSSGEKFDYASKEAQAIFGGNSDGKTVSEIKNDLQKLKDNFGDSRFDAQIEAIKNLPDEAIINIGGLYKVQIEKAKIDSMIDWNSTASDVSESAKDAFKEMGYDVTSAFHKTVGDVYGSLSRKMGAENVSNVLKEHGVIGIKHIHDLDANDTQNYVVFDAKDARVIERNGLKVGDPDIEIPRAYQEEASKENATQAIPDPKFLTTEQKQAFMEKPFADIPQQPGQPKADLYPNINYINSPMDALEAIARATEIVGDKILEQTRGTVSSKQQEQEAADHLAELVGANDTSLLQSRAPGTGAGTTEMWIRGQLMKAAAEDFAEKAKNYDKLTSSPQDGIELLAAAERVSMLSANFQGAASEAGRALQSLKMINAGMKQSELIKKLMDGTPDPAKIADVMQGVTDPVQAANVARKVTAPTPLNTWQQWGQVYKAGLLSGAKTYMVKAIGDTVGIATNIADRLVAAGIGVLHSGEKVTPHEATALITGMLEGIKGALKVGASFWTKDGYAQSEANAWEGHQNVFGVDEKGTPPKPGSVAAIANKVIALPHRIMGAETEVFRILNELGEAKALATRQAIKEKFTPGTNDFNNRVVALITSPTEEMQAAITKAGEDGTFTGELGEFGKIMSKISKHDQGQFVLPFSTVPANLVTWAVKRMPLIANLLDDVKDDFSAGGARRDIAIARQIIGAGVATLAYGYVKDGTITGGGTYLTAEQKNAKIAAGWQPYSIRVGGKYYSYSRFDPMARIAAVAADAAEIHDHLDADDKANLPAMVGAAFGNALVSQTYLASINGMIQALQDPYRHGPQYFDSFIGSWIPAFMGQSASEVDPYARRIDSVFDMIQSKIPELRQNLLPKINPLTGEPAENTSDITPVNVSNISTDPVLSEAARLGVGVHKAPKSIELPALHDREIGKVVLTPEQQNIFQQASGHITHQILSQFVGSETYKNWPDIIRKRVFEMAIQKGNAIGREEALTPAQRIQEAKRIAGEIEAKLRGR
jgi:hypothetical protein